MGKKKELPPPPPAMVEIIEHAAQLQAARSELGDFVRHLNDAIEALKANSLATLRGRIDEAALAWKALEQRIAAHPELFDKPRTQRAHGITFGLEKGKGALEIADPERTVALIEKKYPPEQAALLLITVKKPAKESLEKLPAAELKALGVSIGGTDDRVVIRPADSDVDRLVKVLVKAAVEESAS